MFWYCLSVNPLIVILVIFTSFLPTLLYFVRVSRKFNSYTLSISDLKFFVKPYEGISLQNLIQLLYKYIYLYISINLRKLWVYFLCTFVILKVVKEIGRKSWCIGVFVGITTQSQHPEGERQSIGLEKVQTGRGD